MMTANPNAETKQKATVLSSHLNDNASPPEMAASE